jgi:NAD(P)-dependent dehydrogenase (short-subunit alcohol dehydrogenase family)
VAAQIALGRAIARAGEETGIRCNVIAPGFMDTPMGRDASRRRSDRAVTVPFGRQGTGWEVAYAALFLISNESSYVNAHTLFLDGGHLGGIVRASLRNANGLRLAAGLRNAQFRLTRNFLEQQK